MSSSASSNLQIPRRALGTQGLVVPAQGLGCMGMTAFYGASPGDTEAESLATITRSLELGANFFDTAWVYQDWGATGAKNEELLGKAIKQHGRDKFIIATKFGVDVDATGLVTCSGAAAIKKQLDESLARLGTDYIDLYYQHRHDPNTPIEDVMATLKTLVETGKVKYVGLSECTPDELRRAHKVFPVTAIQMEWSLHSRDLEAQVVPTARELGVGIVAYSPLGRGLLSRNVARRDDLSESDDRRHLPRFSPDNYEANASAGEKLANFARSKGLTAAQVALAYVHNKGDDVFPIPGTRRVARLGENLGASVVKLTPSEMAELEAMVPEATGERYPGMSDTFNLRL